MQNDQDWADKLFESSAYLASTLSRYSSIERYFLSRAIPESSEFEKAVVDVYTACLAYSAAVRANSEASAAKRVLRAFKALSGQPLQDLKAEVDLKDELVRKWGDVIAHGYQLKAYEETNEKADQMLDQMDQLVKNLSLIENALLPKKRQDMLNWICSFDPSQRFNRSLAIREPTTGEWLLAEKEFKAWSQAPTTSLLWLKGSCMYRCMIFTLSIC